MTKPSRKDKKGKFHPREDTLATRFENENVYGK
jgi:hypothetical protein